MPYRVRKSILGRCILQVTDQGHWVDAKPNDALLKPFSITTVERLKEMTERVELAEHRALVLRKSRAKKKAPAGIVVP